MISRRSLSCPRPSAITAVPAEVAISRMERTNCCFSGSVATPSTKCRSILTKSGRRSTQRLRPEKPSPRSSSAIRRPRPRSAETALSSATGSNTGRVSVSSSTMRPGSSVNACRVLPMTAVRDSDASKVSAVTLRNSLPGSCSSAKRSTMRRITMRSSSTRRPARAAVSNSTSGECSAELAGARVSASKPMIVAQPTSTMGWKCTSRLVCWMTRSSSVNRASEGGGMAATVRARDCTIVRSAGVVALSKTLMPPAGNGSAGPTGAPPARAQTGRPRRSARPSRRSAASTRPRR